jgi:hypothetical protein
MELSFHEGHGGILRSCGLLLLSGIAFWSLHVGDLAYRWPCMMVIKRGFDYYERWFMKDEWRSAGVLPTSISGSMIC